MQAWRIVLIICLMNAGNVSLHAGFNFGGRESRIRVNESTAKLVLLSPIIGFQGTLELAETGASRLEGSSITFDGGYLDRGGAKTTVSGLLDAATGEILRLNGDEKLRSTAGTTFNNLTVLGTGNLIEGTPKFAQPIVLTNNATELTLSIQSKLGQNITMNGGTVILSDALRVGDSTTLTGSGTINVNNQTLMFPGKSSTWTSTLEFKNATDVVLNSRTSLSGIWYFGPANSTSVLQGNGNVLDLSLGGSLWIRPGHGLELTDIIVKGISQTLGTIVMEDVNSTVSFSNAILQLAGNYTVTQGSFYFYGARSKIVTGPYSLYFSQRGTMSVDATTVTYDPLDTPDIKNVQPSVAENTFLTLLNSGRLVCEGIGESSYHQIAIDSSYTAWHHHLLTASSPIIFRGIGNTTLTLDGGYYMMQCAPDNTNLLQVSANKVAVIQNVILRDFTPSIISLATGAAIKFADNVVLELGRDCDWNTTLTFQGNCRINGMGHRITLGSLAGMVIANNKTLTIENARLEGVTDVGVLKNFTMQGTGSKLILKDVDVMLDGTTTITQGDVDVYGTVGLHGDGQIFAQKTSGIVTIRKNSVLYLDSGVTYSYDSAAAASNKIAFTSAVSSILQLNGATLHSTHTGLKLSSGRVVIQDASTVSSEASVNAEALVIGSSMDVDVLTGASLNLVGTIIYE